MVLTCWTVCLALVIGYTQAQTMEGICSDPTLVGYIEHFVRLYVHQCTGYDLLDHYWNLCRTDGRWFNCDSLAKYVSIIPSCGFCATRRDPASCYTSQRAATTCDVTSTTHLVVNGGNQAQQHPCNYTGKTTDKHEASGSCEGLEGITVGGAVGLVTLGVCIGSLATTVMCVFIPTAHRRASDCMKTIHLVQCSRRTRQAKTAIHSTQSIPVEETASSSPASPATITSPTVSSGTSSEHQPTTDGYEMPSLREDIPSHKYTHLNQGRCSGLNEPRSEASKALPDTGDYLAIGNNSNIEVTGQNIEPIIDKITDHTKSQLSPKNLNDPMAIEFTTRKQINDDMMDNPEYQPIPEMLNGPVSEVTTNKPYLPISDEIMDNPEYHPIPKCLNGQIANIVTARNYLQPMREVIMYDPKYQAIRVNVDGPMTNEITIIKHSQPIRTDPNNSIDYPPIQSNPHEPIITGIRTENGIHQVFEQSENHIYESIKNNRTNEKWMPPTTSETPIDNRIDSENTNDGSVVYENFPLKDQIRKLKEDCEVHKADDAIAKAASDYSNCPVPADQMHGTLNRTSDHRYFILTKQPEYS